MQQNPAFVHVLSAPLGNNAAVAAAVEALFAALPAAKRITPQSRVLVKPNLLAKYAPERAVTTQPSVVRGVILALQKRGAKRILVADSPGGRYTPETMRVIYAACGIEAVCRETGAELYTACASRKISSNGQRVKAFNMIEPALDCDFIVNIPKLKTHGLTGLSGSVKNLFGCIPGLEKAEFHMRFPQKADFGEMLVDLCETVRADIHIVDGLLAMEGDGPSGGTPRQTDRLFASENPYLLDLALCHYIGISPEDVPTIAAAAARGLCDTTFDPALLICDQALKAPFSAFKLPKTFQGRLDFSSSVPGFLRPVFSKVAECTAPKPLIKKAKCIGCGKCAEICPESTIAITGGRAKITYARCIRCFCCHEMCPVQAIDIRRFPLFKL